MKFLFWFNNGKQKTHLHDWKIQYQTGNAVDGKSDVAKCECGQWAVYHRNYSHGEPCKYHLINK